MSRSVTEQPAPFGEMSAAGPSNVDGPQGTPSSDPDPENATSSPTSVPAALRGGMENCCGYWCQSLPCCADWDY